MCLYGNFYANVYSIILQLVFYYGLCERQAPFVVQRLEPQGKLGTSQLVWEVLPGTSHAGFRRPHACGWSLPNTGPHWEETLALPRHGDLARGTFVFPLLNADLTVHHFDPKVVRIRWTLKQQPQWQGNNKNSKRRWTTDTTTKSIKVKEVQALKVSLAVEENTTKAHPSRISCSDWVATGYYLLAKRKGRGETDCTVYHQLVVPEDMMTHQGRHERCQLKVIPKAPLGGFFCNLSPLFQILNK